MAVAYSGTTLIPPLFGFLVANTSTDLFPYVVVILLAFMLFSVEAVNYALRKAGHGFVQSKSGISQLGKH